MLKKKSVAAAIGFSSSDKMFHIVCTIWLLGSAIIILYPLIYVVACSFSATDAVLSG
jgi:ABC-type maltose transport system permease subunit